MPCPSEVQIKFEQSEGACNRKKNYAKNYNQEKNNQRVSGA